MKIFTIGIIFFILFVIISFAGLGYVIYLVVKKSKEKENPGALQSEKQEMRSKNLPNRANLHPWNKNAISQLSNKMEYNYSKGISQKLNGYLLTLDNIALISFRRVERGLASSLTRISAISSEFELFYEKNKEEITIELDGQYFGKIINNHLLMDKNNQQIGSITLGLNKPYPYHTIKFNNQPVADIIKNSDRRTVVKNRLYRRNPTSSMQKDLYREKHVSESIELVNLLREPNPIEYQWIVYLSIFEGVYNGFDFTY